VSTLRIQPIREYLEDIIREKLASQFILTLTGFLQQSGETLNEGLNQNAGRNLHGRLIAHQAAVLHLPLSRGAPSLLMDWSRPCSGLDQEERIGRLQHASQGIYLCLTDRL
jgi:hypothetical protein